MNVGVIGCGNIGRLHANAYAKSRDVNLCALIDVNLENAQALADEFGGRAYASIDEVQEKLDLVSVVVPPAGHFAIVMDLLDRGIAVFVEKPMTMDAGQARELLKKSKETGIPIGVGFKMRYEAVFKRAKELVAELGEVFSVAEISNQPMARIPEKGWVAQTGVMYELSIHDYDLIHWILDSEPVSISASLDFSWGWPRENGAYLTVDYANGVKGQLMNVYSPGSKGGYDRCLTFVGENGYMRVERPDRIVMNTKEGHREERIEPIPDREVFEIQIQSFVEAVLRKDDYCPGAVEGVVNTLLVEAANKAHRDQVKVMLEEM